VLILTMNYKVLLEFKTITYPHIKEPMKALRGTVAGSSQVADESHNAEDAQRVDR
jgi:hypothetical protein